MARIPREYRRLTRLEAARLGLTYSSRHYVDASIKRVRSTTHIYSEYHVRKFKLGGITPQRASLITKIKQRSFIIEPSREYFDELRQRPIKILKQMSTANREQWAEYSFQYTEVHPDDYNNPFWYHD